MLYGLPLKTGYEQAQIDAENMTRALDEALEDRGYRQVMSRIGDPLGEHCFRIIFARDGIAFETNPHLSPDQLPVIYAELRESVFGTSAFKYDLPREITE